MPVEMIAQTIILLAAAAAAWADLKARVSRVEDECRRTNGRVTKLEKKL